MDRIPVSAKIRSGWDGDHLNAADAARRIEAAGAATRHDTARGSPGHAVHRAVRAGAEAERPRG